MKSNIIIADTSPIIAIAIMELFPVLTSLFEQVVIPEAVIQECLHDLSKAQAGVIEKAFNLNVFEIKPVKNTEYCQLLAQVLDRGEAEAISLAKELKAMALIDEKAGRKIANREGIDYIGSLYILIKAKQNNHIKSVVPLIKRLNKHGYYLDQNLIFTVLEATNEMSNEVIKYLTSP